MTTGIYKLKWPSGMVYIGQAIDIEARWQQHAKNMYCNKAATPVQRQYNLSGLPNFSIVVDCHKDHLNLLEGAVINSIPAQLSLNTVIPEQLKQHDTDILNKHDDLLLASTCSLIRTIINQKQIIEQLQAQSR